MLRRRRGAKVLRLPFRTVFKGLGAGVFVNYEEKNPLAKRIQEATDGGVQGTVVRGASPALYLFLFSLNSISTKLYSLARLTLHDRDAIEYSSVGASIVSVTRTMVNYVYPRRSTS
jgi:hypothetical protein